MSTRAELQQKIARLEAEIVRLKQIAADEQQSRRAGAELAGNNAGAVFAAERASGTKWRPSPPTLDEHRAGLHFWFWRDGDEGEPDEVCTSIDLDNGSQPGPLYIDAGNGLELPRDRGGWWAPALPPGASVASKSPPPGAGALVAYLRHMTEGWGIEVGGGALRRYDLCRCDWNRTAGTPNPDERCEEGRRLAAAVPPLDAVPINGSTWWAVVPAKGAPETAYRNRVDAVRFVRECGEAGDTIRPLSVPPLDEAGAHAAAGGDADDFDLTLLLAPLRDHDGCNHDALVDEVETKIAARLLALRAPTPAPKCTDCDGEGRRMYANTAGARGGIGGQQFTDDVCSTCKGSGEAPAGKDRT